MTKILLAAAGSVMAFVKSLRVRLVRGMGNYIARSRFYLVGFRAHPDANVALSVSVDGGGRGGRIYLGENSSLDIGVVVRAYGAAIRIGSDTTLNPYCVIIGGGDVLIGNGVRIASHVSIVASNHVFSDSDEYIFKQGLVGSGIVIEDNVWIGSGVKILDGVTIGSGSVIGAGAVVVTDIPRFSVAVGVPAKVIKKRV